MVLLLPKERMSPVDFFLENCEPENLISVEITENAYRRMQHNPLIRREKTIRQEERWIAKGCIIEDKEYLPLEYWISKNKGRFFITEIIFGDDFYSFKVRKNAQVVIDYQE